MSKRYSSIRSDRIEYSFWLTFDEKGDVRLSRGYPASLSPRERAMSLSTTLPRSLFSVPKLRAEIVISDQGAPAMQVDVDAAGAALAAALGCEVVMTVKDAANG